MEVEFLSQMRYNLFVSPEQWEDWKMTVSRMYTYHRDVLRQRAIPRKVFHPSIPPSPPVSTIPTSPSFTEQPNSYMPGSPFRMHFAPYTQQDRMSSPHRVLPPMDDSPSAASAAIHARVTSRKRSREENSLSVGLQPPPSKRYQPQYPPPTGALGIQMPPQHPPPAPPQRLHYPTDNLQHPLQQSYQPQSSSTKQPRVGLSLSLPDQTHSPISYHHPQPTSPYAVSPYPPTPQTPTSTPSPPTPSPPNTTTVKPRNPSRPSLRVTPQDSRVRTSTFRIGFLRTRLFDRRGRCRASLCHRGCSGVFCRLRRTSCIISRWGRMDMARGDEECRRIRNLVRDIILLHHHRRRHLTIMVTSEGSDLMIGIGQLEWV